MNPFFQNAKVISRSTDPSVYLATGKEFERGDLQFILSSSHLHELSLNPAKWRAAAAVEEKTWQMDFGSWLDCLLLLPEAHSRFAVTPETITSVGMKCPSCGSITTSKKCRECGTAREPIEIVRPWSRRIDECKAWEEKETKAGRLVISHEIDTEVRTAATGLEASPGVKALIEESDHQVMVMAEYADPDTGIVVPVKSLIDIVPKTGNLLFDFKSTTNGSPGAWNKAVFDRGYHIQGALYLDIYNAAAGEGRDVFGHLVCENTAPFHVPVPWPALSERYLDLGRMTYRTALRDYCRALKTGQWSSYPLPPGAWVEGNLWFVDPKPYMFDV